MFAWPPLPRRLRWGLFLKSECKGIDFFVILQILSHLFFKKFYGIFVFYCQSDIYRANFFHAFFSGMASSPRPTPKPPNTHFLSFDNSKDAEGTFLGESVRTDVNIILYLSPLKSPKMSKSLQNNFKNYDCSIPTTYPTIQNMSRDSLLYELYIL